MDDKAKTEVIYDLFGACKWDTFFPYGHFDSKIPKTAS